MEQYNIFHTVSLIEANTTQNLTNNNHNIKNTNNNPTPTTTNTRLNIQNQKKQSKYIPPNNNRTLIIPTTNTPETPQNYQNR